MPQLLSETVEADGVIGGLRVGETERTAAIRSGGANGCPHRRCETGGCLHKVVLGGTGEASETLATIGRNSETKAGARGGETP